MEDVGVGAATRRSPERLTFPRSLRVRARAEFVRVQDTARPVRTRHLTLLALPRLEAERGAPTRLGVVASKRVGNAVARNRAKRLVREVFRKQRWRLPAGLDLVVIVRAGTHALPYAALEGEVLEVAHLVAARARERRDAHGLAQAQPTHGPRRPRP